MYTDPRNSWVKEVAGGILSLCSVVSWGSSVHSTACYCVMYCTAPSGTTVWRRVGTGRIAPPVHILGRRWKWPLCRSIGHSGLQSGRHALVKKLGRSRNPSAVRKHQHDCHWDRWNGVDDQTCICDVFRVGNQPLVVVSGTLPMSVSAVTKRGSIWVPKNSPSQRINRRVRDGNNMGKDFVPLMQINEWTCLLIVNLDLEKLACYKM